YIVDLDPDLDPVAWVGIPWRSKSRREATVPEMCVLDQVCRVGADGPRAIRPRKVVVYDVCLELNPARTVHRAAFDQPFSRALHEPEIRGELPANERSRLTRPNLRDQ